MTATSVITAWLLVAIDAWGAFPPQPHADEVHQRVAESLVAVAYDPDEPPVYSGETARAKTAVLLASIGALETRYSEHILTGHCFAWECDHHNGVAEATGLLQAHLGRYGLRFVGPRAVQCSRPAADCYTAMELSEDLTLQVKAGIHIYRTLSIRAYTTGRAAMAQAQEWVRGHPVPISDADVLGEQGGS